MFFSPFKEIRYDYLHCIDSGPCYSYSSEHVSSLALFLLSIHWSIISYPLKVSPPLPLSVRFSLPGLSFLNSAYHHLSGVSLAQIICSTHLLQTWKLFPESRLCQLKSSSSVLCPRQLMYPVTWYAVLKIPFHVYANLNLIFESKAINAVPFTSFPNKEDCS